MSANGVPPTWEARDLPVLRAILEVVEETGRTYVTPQQIVQRTTFDTTVVNRALDALAYADPPMLAKATRYPGGGYMHVGPPTERARRAVGLWPTPGDLADRIISALDHAAEYAATDEDRGKIRKAASFLAGAGRDLLVQITTKALVGS